jgi:hypothetical protein
MIETIVKICRGIFRVKGATDGTLIGNVSDSLKTTVTSSALPTGASTSANQSTGNASLSSIDGKLTNNATSTLQTAGNASLSSIDGKVSTEAKQDTQITNQGVLNTRIGDLTEAAPASDTASSGLNGRLQRIAQRLTSIFTALTDGSQQTKLKGDTDGTLIGNDGDRLLTDSYISEVKITENTIALFGAAQSSGLLVGESYDEVRYVGAPMPSFVYYLEGIEQFTIEITVNSQTDWRVVKALPFGFLLQENGDIILQENGDSLLVQGLIPT